ncbi:hypothetical protein QFC21_001498 [Naganishia friedmannii]|uniref:Uncharacterized protein n=1 Tax=Naganishia friedmannii TaxID=89922 RepID=A0ACC2W6U6_9TREE|nr:hypothetical protein QFC21_001498 [Naganishia friedmannii]
MPITTSIASIPGYTPHDIPRLILPFLILYIQAYLLLSHGPSSRWIRVALLPASLASLKGVWLDRRIVDERYVIWNFVLGCAAVFYAVLSIVYSLLSRGPTRTPSQGPARDAFHLITSPRLIGWSAGMPAVWDPYPEFEPLSFTTTGKQDITATSGGGKRAAESHIGESNGNGNGHGHGHSTSTTTTKPQPRTLTQAQVTSKTLRIHFEYALGHYIILDTLTFAFHTLGRRGIGHPRGGSLYASAGPTLEFFHRLFPSMSYAGWMEWLILQLHLVTVHLAVGMAFYQALCFGYHVAACAGLLVGWGEGGDWQRLMKRPLGADSLVGFWGRRWHQGFKERKSKTLRACCKVRMGASKEIIIRVAMPLASK